MKYFTFSSISFIFWTHKPLVTFYFLQKLAASCPALYSHWHILFTHEKWPIKKTHTHTQNPGWATSRCRKCKGCCVSNILLCVYPHITHIHTLMTASEKLPTQCFSCTIPTKQKLLPPSFQNVFFQSTCLVTPQYSPGTKITLCG